MKVTKLIVAMTAILSFSAAATVVETNQPQAKPAAKVGSVSTKPDSRNYLSTYIEQKNIGFEYDSKDNYGGGNVVDYSQSSDADVTILGGSWTSRQDDWLFNLWGEVSISGDYETKSAQTGSVCGGKCKSTDSDYWSIGGDVLYHIDTNLDGKFYAGGSVKYYEYDTGSYKANDVNNQDKFDFTSIAGMGMYVVTYDRWVFDVNAEVGLGLANFTTSGVDPVVAVTESREIDSTLLFFGAEAGATYIIGDWMSVRGYVGFTESTDLSADCSRSVSFISGASCSAESVSFDDYHVGVNFMVNTNVVDRL
jgi:hypothetical protein